MTLLAAILDEVAFLRDEQSALPDLELYRALKPALATTGGLILGISSPWAQRGLLYQKYKRHHGKDGPVLVWQSDSLTMHPGLSAELIAEAQEDDPEAAAAEWGGSFRSDLESYISTAVIDAVTTPGLEERPPMPATSYVAFLDAAGGSGKDSFTCAVAHLAGDVAVLDALREVRPPFDPIAVTAELAEFLRTYGVTSAQADKYAGQWVVESFSKHGIHVEQSAEPKSTLYLGALPMMTGRKADLLDLPRLRHQLVSLERRRRSGGRDIVDHPPSGHDDCANAVVGALLLASALACGAAAPTFSNLLDPYTGERLRWERAARHDEFDYERANR